MKEKVIDYYTQMEERWKRAELAAYSKSSESLKKLEYLTEAIKARTKRYQATYVLSPYQNIDPFDESYGGYVHEFSQLQLSVPNFTIENIGDDNFNAPTEGEFSTLILNFELPTYRPLKFFSRCIDYCRKMATLEGDFMLCLDHAYKASEFDEDTIRDRIMASIDECLQASVDSFKTPEPPILGRISFQCLDKNQNDVEVWLDLVEFRVL